MAGRLGSGELPPDDAARAFRRLFECAPVAIGLITLDGHMFAANPTAASLLGFPEAALRGRAITDVTHPDEAARLSETFGALVKGERERYETDRRIVRADGTTVTIRVTAALVRDDDRSPLFVVSVYEPIDETVEELRAETRSTAHDLNNLLMAVVGRTELLVRQELPAEGEAHASQIRDAAYRAAALVRRLLTSDPAEPPSGPTDLNDVILGMHGVMSQLVGSGDQIVLKLDPSQPKAAVSREGFERALGNLAANARDAMPGGGTVTIESRSIGDTVEVAFSDTGVGISAELAHRIFEPEFSTKPPGEGHGIGLANVRAFVVGAGGTIRVESVPGDGSTFTISLPRV
ncbi:MAG TPA: ATP-binding protein [Gaiellaceae bacterium]|nr:ATP-binding protein [Gaiellaceae bacterium]